MATKYAYTFSSRGNLPIYLYHSIRSLLRYVDNDDIIVFATPPIEDSHISILHDLGVDVRKRDHAADAFSAFSGSVGHYGDKAHLTTIDSQTVVFLDCDTLVFSDPRELVTGSKFRAREGTAELDSKSWQNMFEEYDEEYMDWMPNCGVLVFDNYFHQDISEKWIEYLDTDLPKMHQVYHKEQYALSLAISGEEIDKMTPREHVMEWNNELPSDGIIYHQGSVFSTSSEKSIIKEIFDKLQNIFLYNSW